MTSSVLSFTCYCCFSSGIPMWAGTKLKYEKESLARANQHGFCMWDNLVSHALNNTSSFPLTQEYHFPDWETHPAACTNTATCSPPDPPSIKLGWVGSQRLSQSNWTFDLGWLLWTFSARTDCTKIYTNSPNLHKNEGEHSGDYSLMQGTNPSLQSLLSVREK